MCTQTCDPIVGGCSAGNSCYVFDTDVAREVTDCLPTGSGTSGIGCTDISSCSDGYACVARVCRRVCASGSACASGACQAVPLWARYGYCAR